MVGFAEHDETIAAEELENLYNEAEIRRVTDEDRIVIFSDLHMGNGSRNDDFRHNGELFHAVLEQYYLHNGYHLILNGDVEELQRFSWRSISRRWYSVYELFNRIQEENGITRLVGNHDLELKEGGPSVGFPATEVLEIPSGETGVQIRDALRLQHREGELFLFHGHQTSRWYRKHNNIARLLLRYIANPLHLKNLTVAADSRKQFKIERRAYQFASQKKIIAVIGHTHRPLFESMSKADSILYEIEHLCRTYPHSTTRDTIRERVAVLKEKLVEVRQQESEQQFSSSLYREHLIVPSLFNSGCVLGRRGMTCLEIRNGTIALVYWFDDRKRGSTRQFRAYAPSETVGGHFHRAVVRQDTLQYIFSRIRLLA